MKGGSSDDARATRPRVIPISGVSIDLFLEIGLLHGKVKPRPATMWRFEGCILLFNRTETENKRPSKQHAAKNANAKPMKLNGSESLYR